MAYNFKGDLLVDRYCTAKRFESMWTTVTLSSIYQIMRNSTEILHFVTSPSYYTCKLPDTTLISTGYSQTIVNHSTSTEVLLVNSYTNIYVTAVSIGSQVTLEWDGSNWTERSHTVNNYIYYGNPYSDGSFRTSIGSGGLLTEKKESGIWVAKQLIT